MVRLTTEQREAGWFTCWACEGYGRILDDDRVPIGEIPPPCSDCGGNGIFPPDTPLPLAIPEGVRMLRKRNPLAPAFGGDPNGK